MGVVSRRNAIACGAAILGLLWYAGLLGVALSPLFIEVWKQSRSRREAFENALAYYAGATLPMALGQGAYAAVEPLEVLLIALASAAVLASIWALGWTGLDARWARRVVGLAFVLAVTAAPGIGFIGVASPLTAAGAWFPGTGFAGLALLVIVASTRWSSLRAVSAVAICGALLASGAHVTSSRAATDARLEGLSTSVATSDQATDYRAQFMATLEVQQALEAHAAHAQVFVLGEGLGGIWSEAMEEAWSEASKRLVSGGRALVLGASLPEYGRGYRNGALVIDAAGTRFVQQRAPLPYVMWRPWADVGSYDARPMESGVVDVAGSRAGVLICWEQLLVFPVLWSVLGGADSLIGLSNLHHVGGAMSLERWQRAALASWAALFAMPTAYAVNR